MSLASAIATIASALEQEERSLVAAISAYDRIKGLGGQRGYSITIDGVPIQVATMEGRTYLAKLVRGRDMIHLGALKALDAEIDCCRARIDIYKASLAEHAEQLSNSLRGAA